MHPHQNSFAIPLKSKPIALKSIVILLKINDNIEMCKDVSNLFNMKMQFFHNDGIHIIAFYANIIVNDGDIIAIIIKKLHFH